MSEGFRVIDPQGWRPPKGYSNGILSPPGARLLAVAGQVGWDEEQRLVAEDLAPQFEQALRNVLQVVQAAGGEAGHVLRLTFYVLDRNEYLAQTRAIGRHFRGVFGRHFPACTLVEVSGLLEPGARVEIEATAAIPVDSGARGPA